MTQQEQREAARQFYYDWKDKGKEDEHDHSYWIDIFQKILGVEDATKRIEFQKKVLVNGHTKRIDAYVPETRVIIEQKTKGIPLDKKIHNSGDIDLTPYEQAKRYNDNLPTDEKAYYIVTSNFTEIWIYDMNKRDPEEDIQKINIENLQTEFYRLDFLIKKEAAKITREMEVSMQAGEIVGLLYDELYKNYAEPNEETLKSLNKLCVRLVFCMYAEDAGLFGKKDMFYDYLINIEPKRIRRALKDLFRILDTPEDKRDPDEDEDLLQFPYVNGGLFSDEEISIPQFTEELKDILLQKASNDFDWSDISPTIFGAIFESTLNPETRRSGGMHYTSIENIHKVIDPLFLDNLKTELEEIRAKKNVGGMRTKALKAFQDKLASLKFLDPAAGSGNFLTESYTSLRKLENIVLKELKSDIGTGQMQFDFINTEELIGIKVSIQQFYGIEINDFAVTVAKTALWIAEAQMMKETMAFADIHKDFLPLKSYVNITEGNALRMDWNDVLSANECSYIMGNPPFLGYSNQTPSQKEDIIKTYIDEKGKSYKTSGKIDYVSGWYFKASEYIYNKPIKVAFVSTNSITQGEQVASVWKPLYDRFNIHIDFAYKTFRWDSEASIKAHVHCVIIGFSSLNISKYKVLYDNGDIYRVEAISPYLISGKPIFIESRNKPICDVLPMSTGNRPADGGHLIIEAEDYDDFIRKEPKAIKYIKKLTGSVEFINNKKRYCLWLVNVSPNEIREMPEVMKRIEACRNDRLNGAEDRQKLAATPTIFRETKNPESYIIVPRVSSENRRYIPMGFLDKSIIPTDSATIIIDAKLYEFGILESNVHMAWMRAVAGRLKSDYRYSKDIVYNNFPWPAPTEEQKKKIEETAQGILDARALYPDSSLADLYDPLLMPPELQKAHTQNDIAVMKAYGFNIKEMSEADCVAELMKMYQEMTKSDK